LTWVFYIWESDWWFLHQYRKTDFCGHGHSFQLFFNVPWYVISFIIIHLPRLCSRFTSSIIFWKKYILKSEQKIKQTRYLCTNRSIPGNHAFQ
jgi:hypothetical protein